MYIPLVSVANTWGLCRRKEGPIFILRTDKGMGEYSNVVYYVDLACMSATGESCGIGHS